LDLTEKLRELIIEHLQDYQYFIVDIKVSGGGGKQKVVVLLDGDNGISIEMCAKVSRKLANSIEELDLIADAFNLEVSSPGLDNPLLQQRQYRKNIGRKLNVILNSQLEIKGELLEVDETKIKIKEEYKEKGKKKTLYREIEIPFTDIIKTNVLVIFK
jgi:ribosome maturation factor RimP